MQTVSMTLSLPLNPTGPDFAKALAEAEREKSIEGDVIGATSGWGTKLAGCRPALRGSPVLAKLVPRSEPYRPLPVKPKRHGRQNIRATV
jgi:hypothetical protein